MGYYIEVPNNRGKAKQLVELHGAEIIPEPASFDEIPADKALICVVDNGIFEAAGYCYSPAELYQFGRSLGRRRQWVLMDKQLVEKLTGFSRAA